MAQKVQVLLLDDIDGSPADETVTFGLDGTEYEIDLTKERAAALRKGVAKFVDAARKATTRSTGPGRARPARAAAGPARVSSIAVREWVKANPQVLMPGETLKDRGRVPGHLVMRFQRGDTSPAVPLPPVPPTPASVIPEPPAPPAEPAAPAVDAEQQQPAAKPRGRKPKPAAEPKATEPETGPRRSRSRTAVPATAK